MSKILGLIKHGLGWRRVREGWLPSAAGVRGYHPRIFFLNFGQNLAFLFVLGKKMWMWGSEM